MVVVGRTESVMADGDRLQLFYELCGAWCAFIPRLKKVLASSVPIMVESRQKEVSKDLST